MARLILTTFGTLGALNSSIALGLALRSRGAGTRGAVRASILTCGARALVINSPEGVVLESHPDVFPLPFAPFSQGSMFVPRRSSVLVACF